jgi:hypothetical protein
MIRRLTPAFAWATVGMVNAVAEQVRAGLMRAAARDQSLHDEIKVLRARVDALEGMNGEGK